MSSRGVPRSGGNGRLVGRVLTVMREGSRIAFLVVAGGCSPPSPNVISLRPCDTIAPRSASPVPIVPQVARPGAETSALVGFVSDRTWNTGISGAVVRLAGPSALETGADSSGGYRFSGLPPGSYSVLVVALGYEAGRDTVRARPGSIETALFHLRYRVCP